MLNALNKEEQPRAPAFLTILGILMLSVSLSALSTQNVQETRLAETIIVKTLVQVSVGYMHHAELGTIFPSVLVILDIQGMHLLPAQELQLVRFLVEIELCI